MKKVLTLFIVLLLASSSSFCQSWTQVASIPDPNGLLGPVSFSINGKLYVGGGYNGSIAVNTFYQYDPANNSWTTKASLPSAEYAAYSFVIDGKGYVACGANPSLTNTVYMYDPALNTWTQKANFPGSARQNGVGFSFNSKGYITCGFIGGASTVSEMWEYNATTDTWTQKSSIPGSGRNNPSCLVFNNQVFVGLGSTVNASQVYSDFYRFDPVLDTFFRVADMPSGRSCAVSFSTGSLGYVGLGLTDASSYLDDFYSYDPQGNAWAHIADFPGVARRHAFAEVVGGRPYLGCGDISGSGNTRDVWSYSPSAIGDIAASEQVSVSCYPVPSSGEFNIHMSGYTTTDKQVAIYNQLGQMVYQSVVNGEDAIITTNLSAGAYIVSVSDTKLSSHTRMIIK